jgi:molybdopterin-guanine dinucleotide biosynthesis protein MobB
MTDIPVLSIVGASGSGKTTVLEQLIRELVRRGYRIAVIKHHPYPGLIADAPGKDTWRLARAGAEQVTLAAPDQEIHRRRLTGERSLEEIAADIQDVDLILTEGYKRGNAPKVEVNRRAHHPTLVSPPDELLAILSDQRFDLPVPQLSLHEIVELANLIEAHLLSGRETAR